MARSNLSGAWAEAAFYLGLSFIIPISAVAGYFAGAYLDRHLHTGSVLGAAGAVVGAVAGITDVVYTVARKEKSAGNQ
ncbi:MAG TPA: AtpZ/AtpI family protein [Terriglobia bacterium]|nr:AtpZ/AtpI family protein [Terriglobia bacterium]